MNKPRILFLHGLDPRLVELVVSPCPTSYELIALSGNASEDDQIEAIEHADFLMIYRAKPSDAVLGHGSRLKFIQLLAAGYDDMNVALMHRLGIPCANNGGANSWAVADQTVLLMLALYRRVWQIDQAVRQGRWNRGVDGQNTFELAGKTVGILGLGNIGRQVAQRVRAFDARVRYFNPVRLSEQEECDLGVTFATLDQLFTESDILTLHAPLTSETRQLVSRARLATMKRSAIIVNTSRGPVIDEAALIDALTTGALAGAGLDAFEQEPVAPNNPLLRLDNVVLSPHSAGTTSDTWRRRGAFAFENINRVLAGKPPLAQIRLPGDTSGIVETGTAQ
jgi:phosphoglycerate dehydrogenase-like enzyme